MQTQTKETLAAMTPDKALALLKEGNQRFVNGQAEERQLMQQMTETSEGQYPFAVVLGCVDSRVPPELVFDLGIGDIFGVRIAGNFVNEDILGSMEFATKVVGSKLILVMGHTSCGAIQGAMDDVELGNLTGLVGKLKPAVAAYRSSSGEENRSGINEIAKLNVEMTIEDIKKRSPVLKELVDNGEIAIAGAMYDVASGKVDFL
ncbi:MAG: carbonic anhydrase [Chloroflexi bacterium]|nr:MAG: carbonic anhydrase [Chloroflexota bacterium]